MFRLVGCTPFRRLLLAHTASRAGDAFNTVALVVLVFELTGSGLGVAGAVMFEVLPVLLFAPVAGLAADRLPRRRLMVGADWSRAGTALVLVAITDSAAVAYALAFCLSIGAVEFNPASASLLPEVVGDDDVVAANSAMWTAAVLAQIALALWNGARLFALAAGGIPAGPHPRTRRLRRAPLRRGRHRPHHPHRTDPR